jgi:hypothetical protein
MVQIPQKEEGGFDNVTDGRLGFAISADIP